MRKHVLALAVTAALALGLSAAAVHYHGAPGVHYHGGPVRTAALRTHLGTPAPPPVHYHGGPEARAGQPRPALPAILFGHLYEFQNVGYGLWLHGHAHNALVTDNSVPSNWQLINQAVINGVTYGELEDGSTGLCTLYSPSNGFDVYLEGCSPGDGYELVSIRQSPGSPAGQMWFVPQPYDGNPPSGFYTDHGPSNYTIGVNSGGSGNYALWKAFLVN